MELKSILLSSLILALAVALTNPSEVKPHFPVSSFRATNVALRSSYIEYYPTIINVSDYDGESDTERIQKALNDVPPEGAIVFIPSGIWEACNLTVRSKTVLMGTNSTIVRRPVNTTIPFLTFKNQSDFAVLNLIFEGQNISQATGILISNGTQFQIANNTFREISRNAIRVTATSKDFTIQNNKLVRCNEASILLFGSPGQRYIKNFTVTANLLVDGIDNGKIGVAFAANGTVSNNTILNCEHGIATRGVSHITVENNRIENCSRYALYLGTQPGDPGSDNIKIVHNQAVNCNIGISRWYGSQPITNVTLADNNLTYNRIWDVYADFPATFSENTLTSETKLKLLNANVKFTGNTDVEGQPIIPGDINHDLKIDMKDIGATARLFGCTPQSENWNPTVDIIGDEIINMEDIAFVAKQFGFQWT